MFNRGLVRPLDQLGGQITGTFTRALGIATVAVGGFMGLGIWSGTQRALGLERAQLSLENMGLATRDISTLMEGLNDALLGTSFGLDEGALAMSRLVSAGIPIEDIQGILENMTDAAAFGNVPLSQMTDLFTTIASRGKLSADELNRFGEQGVPALQLLADAAGVTTGEFRAMVTEGEIDADRFFALWDEGAKGFGENNIVMEGAAQDMGQATETVFANMRTSIARFTETFVTELLPVARDVMSQVTEFFTDAGVASEDAAVSFAEWASDTIQGTVIPAVESFVDWFKNDLIPAVQTARDFFEENEETILKVRDALVVAVPAVAGLGTAVRIVNLAIAATPIGLIFALASALVFAWQNSETFRDIVTGVIDTVSKVLAPLIDLFGGLADEIGGTEGAMSTLQGVFRTAIETIGGVIDGIVGFFANVVDSTRDLTEEYEGIWESVVGVVERVQEIIEGVAGEIAAFWEEWGDEIAEIFAIAWETVVGIVDAVFNTIEGILDVFIGVFTGDWQRVWDGLVGILQGAWDKVVAIFTGVFRIIGTIFSGFGIDLGAIWQGALDGITGAASAAGDFIAGVWDGISSSASTVFGGMATTVGELWGGITGGITEAVSGVGEFVGGIWETLNETTGGWFETIGETIAEVWDGIREFFVTAFDTIKDLFTGNWGAVFGTVNRINQNINTRLTAIWANIVESIRKIIGDVVKWIGDRWKAVRDTARTWWGRIVGVVEAAIDAVDDFIRRIIRNVVKWLSGRWTAIRDTARTWFERVRTAIVGKIEAVDTRVRTIIGNIVTWLGDRWEGIRNTARTWFERVRTAVVGKIEAIDDRIRTIIKNVRDWLSDRWEGIRDTAALWWDRIKNVLVGDNGVITKIQDGFETIIDSIGDAWEGLKELAAAPVNFVIETIYGQGIKPLWDFFAELVNLPKAPVVNPVTFARGGFVEGDGPPGQDSVPALLAPDEFVLRNQATRVIAPDFLWWLNGLTSRSQFERGMTRTGGDMSDIVPGYQAGGYAKGPEEALKWARQNTGRYQWGGFGPLFDCSGYMAAISNFAATGNFRSGGRWATGQAANRPDRIGRFIKSHAGEEGFNIGISPRGWGAGHTAGTLAGTNVESTGSIGSHVGGRRGASYGELAFHLPDYGGLSSEDKGFLSALWDLIRGGIPEMPGRFDDLFDIGEDLVREAVDWLLTPLPGFVGDWIKDRMGLEEDSGFGDGGGGGGSWQNGAWINPTPGGIWGRVGEGRHAEVVSPVPKLRELIQTELQAANVGGPTVNVDGMTFEYHGQGATEEEARRFGREAADETLRRLAAARRAL